MIAPVYIMHLKKPKPGQDGVWKLKCRRLSYLRCGQLSYSWLVCSCSGFKQAAMLQRAGPQQRAQLDTSLPQALPAGPKLTCVSEQQQTLRVCTCYPCSHAQTAVGMSVGPEAHLSGCPVTSSVVHQKVCCSIDGCILSVRYKGLGCNLFVWCMEGVGKENATNSNVLIGCRHLTGNTGSLHIKRIVC